MDAAREQKQHGESDAQGFARFYSALDNLDLRKARRSRASRRR
jgi:hypothetical protein